MFKTQLAACFLNIPKEIINVDIKEQINTPSNIHSDKKESLQKVVSLLLAHQIQKNNVFKNQIAIFILDSLKKISDRLTLIRDEKKTRKSNYAEKLKSCGQATYCMIYRGKSIRIWRKFNIPYKKFINNYKGYYKPNIGYYCDMSRETFLKFIDQYGILDSPVPITNNYKTATTTNDYQNPICANIG